MKCPTCGTEIPGDSTFCYSCGAKVEPVTAPPRAVADVPAFVRPATTADTARSERTSASSGAGVRAEVGHAGEAGVSVRQAPPTTTSRYAGASLVATTLWIIGWLIAIIGAIAAMGLAVSLDCSETLDTFDCSEGEELGLRLGIFIGGLIAAWLIAISVLWSAYVLRLLCDMEVSLRRSR